MELRNSDCPLTWYPPGVQHQQTSVLNGHPSNSPQRSYAPSTSTETASAYPPSLTDDQHIDKILYHGNHSFQLIFHTTAGTFPSNLLRVRTHTMSDTSGISVCFSNVQDPVLLENVKLALREMGAKWSDTIQIDTSH